MTKLHPFNRNDNAVRHKPAYFVHVHREFSKPLPGVFLLDDTCDMQTGCRTKSRAEQMIMLERLNLILSH